MITTYLVYYKNIRFHNKSLQTSFVYKSIMYAWYNAFPFDALNKSRIDFLNPRGWWHPVHSHSLHTKLPHHNNGEQFTCVNGEAVAQGRLYWWVSTKKT